MECRLCKKDNKLVKSHIIPDFLYTGLFDDKHFIAPLDLIEFKRKKLLPNGFYDKAILCSNCDNVLIGSLESYSRTVIHGSQIKSTPIPKMERRINQLNQKYLYITDIDYSKFKLFLLSILWRASITNHDFFKNVFLGDHEKVIGDMILKNDPKEYQDYSVGIFILNENNSYPTKLIANPIRSKTNENLSYSFLINGLVINYKISGEMDRDMYDQISIKEDGTMKVFIFDEENGQEYIDLYLHNKIRYKK